MEKKILFLGGSTFQIPNIKQAKKMGLYVGVVDISSNAPAIKYADESFECSIKDEKGVFEIAKAFNADAVSVGICDSAMNTAAYVCEKLGLPGTSVETAKCATDKFEMIKAFERCDVAHPQFQLIEKENLHSTEIKVPYPLVTKPIDAAGSKGIRIARSQDEIYDALEESSKSGYDGNVLVEELMEGPEVSVEIIVQNGIPFVAQVTDKLTSGEPYFVEIGHSQPSHFDGDVLENIKNVARNAAVAVGLKNSIAHAEIMVTKNGPKMVEIGGRMGGDSISEQLIMLSSGYNLSEANINFAFGKEYVVSQIEHYPFSAVRFVTPENGIIKDIKGIEAAELVEGIFEINMMANIGDSFNDSTDNSQRVGYVIAYGTTRDKAVEACEKAKNLISIEYE